jgi:hypothetical protein
MPLIVFLKEIDMKYLLTLLVFIMLSQYYILCNVTDLKLNEQVEIYNQVENVDGYAYFFVTYPACASCLESMEVLINYLDSGGKFDIKVFISGISVDYIETIKKEKGWKIDIILDKLGAYHKLYKLNKTNSLLLINNNHLLKYSECFSDKFEIQSLIDVIEEIKKSNEFQHSLNHSIAFKIDDKPLVKNYGILGLYSDQNQTYYFSQINEGILYISDSTGNIIKSIDLKKGIQTNRFRLMQMTWRVKNQLILLHFQNVNNRNLSNILIEYDIVNESFEQIYLSNSLDDEMLEIYGNTTDSGYLISKFLEPSTLLSDSVNDIIIVYSEDKDIIAGDNLIDSIYYQFDLIGAFRQFLCFGQNEILSIQMFSRNLMIYDNQLKLSKRIKLDNSTNLRETKQGLPTLKSKSDWVGFSSQNSYYQYIHSNPIESLVLLGYFNYVVPEGILDLESPDVKTNWFFDLFNISGKFVKSLKIPESYPWVIYFDGKRIAYMHTTDNVVKVNWIVLSSIE